jgi:Tol biopolymer transport system component
MNQGKGRLFASMAAVSLLLMAGCQQSVMFVRDEGGVWKTFQMNEDGSSQSNVSPSGSTRVMYPDVSPNGERVAYTDGLRVFTSNRGDIGGSSQRLLSTGTGRKTFLRWSPDQLTVAYAEFFTPTQVALWLADASGASSLQVTWPTGSQSDGWGHDFYRDANGVQYLVYSRDGQLHSMYFNGTQPATRIVNDGPTVHQSLPIVSPDNSLLAFRSATMLAPQGTLDHIRVVGVGTWQNRYAILLPAAQIRPGSISGISFSCDNQKLYVAADPVTSPAGMHEIFSVKLDGTGLTRLTNNGVFDSQPNAVPVPCY